MIRNKQYRYWSSEFHFSHSREPIVAQMEITYRCPLHCLHCYSDCYDNSQFAESELSTQKVKLIIDKLYDAGCLWFCFTGGDPLMRDDFIELYRYAKKKGFIVTVMTSLVELSPEVLKTFKDFPPFSLETTLNGATAETFDSISQVKGSFKKIIANIEKVKSARLSLKIKTLLSKNNFSEKDKLCKLIESFGCKFSPSTQIYSRLNGDTSVCRYRLEPQEIAGVPEQILKDTCAVKQQDSKEKLNKPNPFFRCAVGNWQWFIDPLGRLNLCNFFRKPSYNLLEGNLKEGTEVLSGFVKSQKFKTNSSCKHCRLWQFCLSCPAQAELEVGHEEAPIPYYCRLASRYANYKYEERISHIR